ncbi:MAG: hypothetical protein R2748_30390 [Bryobacterales bacterium]
MRSVPAAGFQRNIFQYGERQRVVQPLSQADRSRPSQRPIPNPPPASTRPLPSPASPPHRRAATAPRLTWKYYGFASPSGDGKRRAFLLDGEHVLIGSEGDASRGRYKVKRVGLTSIVVEDMEYSEEQTLPITAPAS